MKQFLFIFSSVFYSIFWLSFVTAFLCTFVILLSIFKDEINFPIVIDNAIFLHFLHFLWNLLPTCAALRHKTITFISFCVFMFFNLFVIHWFGEFFKKDIEWVQSRFRHFSTNSLFKISVYFPIVFEVEIGQQLLFYAFYQGLLIFQNFIILTFQIWFLTFHGF